MKNNKTFTKNDIYVISYINRDDNSKYPRITEDDIIIIGEVNAHKLFDDVVKIKAHDEITLYKGEVTSFGSVIPGTEIRSWTSEAMKKWREELQKELA